MIRSGLFGIFFVASFLFVARAQAAILDPGTINSCGELAVAGTYTLGSDIGSGGDCIVVTSDGVVIDGTKPAGGVYVITGNIVGDALNAGDPGFNFTVQNIHVTGDVSANALDWGSGGVGGSLTISSSTVSSVYANGDFGEGTPGGSGGFITISSSTVSSVIANGGRESDYSPLGAGNGGSITISSSSVSSITADGGTETTYADGSGGSGGSITINAADLNLNGIVIDVSGGGYSCEPGYNWSCSNGANGTLVLNYINTITYTNVNFPALSDLIINNSNNQPGNLGYFTGGILVLPSDAISSQAQCGNLSISGTYLLGSDITGDCHVYNSGIIIDGQGKYTIHGNIYGGGMSGGSGNSFSVQNVTVTGAVSSDGATSAGCSSAAGGSITVSSSTVGYVSSNGGYDGLSCPQYDAGGGPAGSITISSSTVISVYANGGGSSNAVGGASGSIIISSSTVLHAYANGGDGSITGGSITISSSTVLYAYAVGGDGMGLSSGGSGGTITVTGIHPDLTNTTLNVSDGDDGCGGQCYGFNSYGSLSFNYTTLGTTTGLSLSPASDFIINGTHYGFFAGSGGFPTIYPGQTITQTTGCNIYFSGVYTLGENITSSCFVANNVVLDGAGHTIAGDISADAPGFPISYNGWALTIQNAIVNGSVSSNGYSDGMGTGTGGSISILSSTIHGSIYSNAADDIGEWGGQSGGSITISSSTVSSVYANGSGTYGISGGHGGTIAISGANNGVNLNLSTTTLDVSGGDDLSGMSYGRGANGTLNVDYQTSLLTNTATLFSNIGDLIVNEISYGAWNGVFNPHVYYFNDVVTGAGHDGDWNNPLNWWDDIAFTAHSGLVPVGPVDVVVVGNITQNTSGQTPVLVNSIIFNGSSQNHLNITAGKGITFNDSSVNYGQLIGQTIFNGSTINSGSITGSSIFNSQSTHNGTTTGLATFNGDKSNDNGAVNNSATWTKQTGSGQHSWYSITSSADGIKLAAGEWGGYIYTSTDSGVTWTAQNSGSRYWHSITSSADGSKLAAVAYNGQIYTSTDSGVTWTAQNSGNTQWYSITSSADGSKLAAVELGGSIYLSSDYGVTWTEQPAAGSHSWYSITSDSSGKYLAAVSSDYWNSGGIYTSTDYGATWTKQPAAGSRLWYSITSSADGSKLAAVAYNDSIYTLSGLGLPKTTNIPTRVYSTDTNVGTRDFTLNTNGSHWWIEAVGSVVNLSQATYDTTVNFFKALLGGSFIANPNINGGASVVPQLVFANLTGAVIKWQPHVTWDTSIQCSYSYDNQIYTGLDCSKNGADIPRPNAGSYTIYLQGIDVNGNVSQTAGLAFTYNNTVPVWTACGSDLLDEATRPYYYLQGNVIGNCTATVSTELRGNITPAISINNGYSVSGNVIATSSSSGLSISLKGIKVLGAVIVSGAINLLGTGYNGGTVTIATSTTGNIYANGGDGTTNGGIGGIVTVTNSLEVSSSTSISVKGGDATYCGYGGNGGIATLVKSTYDVIEKNAGSNMTTDIAHGGNCSNPPVGSSGIVGQSTVQGTYSSPNSGGGDTGGSTPSTPTPTHSQSTGGGSVGPGGIFNVLPPVTPVGKLDLKPLPAFGETTGTKKGDTRFSFIDNVQKFLFAPLSVTTDKAITTYLNSVGITHDQDLVSLRTTPIAIKKDIPGLFTVTTSLIPQKTPTGWKTSTAPLTTYLASSKDQPLSESVTVLPHSTLAITFTPGTKGTPEGTFNGEQVTFTKSGKSYTTTITVPTTPGTYILKSPGSPLPLTIVVPRPKVATAPVSKPVIPTFFSWLRNIF